MDGNEEPGVGSLPQAIGSDPATGDEKVDVGMVLELAGPGVQDGGDSRSSAEPLGIGADIDQGG